MKVDTDDPALLSKQLVVLFQLMCGDGHPSHTPHELVAAVWACCPQFHGFRQHDSQELLLAVLDRLRQEEKFLVSRGQTPSNVVDELFQGRTATELRFKHRDGTKLSKTDFIGSITIEIPKASHGAVYQAGGGSSGGRSRGRRRNNCAPCSVEGCLRRSTEPVVLDGNDTYATMQQCYANLPSVLVIHINRTDWMRGMKKIAAHVGFPFRGLNMAGSIASVSRSTTESALQQIYDLCSVVVHHGRAMNQGHFTAFAIAHGEWYHFNDHKVTRVSEARVAAQPAYLLVYQRRER